jgi:hypothetical protein
MLAMLLCALPVKSLVPELLELLEVSTADLTV